MNCLRSLFIFVIVLSLQFTPITAVNDDGSSNTSNEETVTIYSENDSPYYKPNESTDENQTNAAGVSLLYEPAWAKDLAPYMPFADAFGPADYGAGFVLGHLIFTPEDITIAEPQPDDHPWAGYLFAGGLWQRTDKQRTKMDHVQFDLGVVGPAARAEFLQETVHSYFGNPEPEGWDNQLPNEITGNLHVRRKWRLFPGSVDVVHPNLTYDVIPIAGASVGTVLREIRVGSTVRAGWKLPENFGPGRLLQLQDATGTAQRGFSAYGFGRATGRAVQHNIFLDGSDFQDSPSVDRKPLVGELQGGVKLLYRTANWQADLTYSQTAMSRTFEQQDDGHAFGTWTISCSLDF